MFWVQLCVMFGVVFVVCMVALGGDGGLGSVHPDRPDVAMPPDRLMVRPDVDSLRFSTGIRGYRMDEVDDVLDRLAAELQVRDDYIAQLQAKLSDDHPAPDPAVSGGSAASVEAAGRRGELAEADGATPDAVHGATADADSAAPGLHAAIPEASTPDDAAAQQHADALHGASRPAAGGSGPAEASRPEHE